MHELDGVVLLTLPLNAFQKLRVQIACSSAVATHSRSSTSSTRRVRVRPTVCACAIEWRFINTRDPTMDIACHIRIHRHQYACMWPWLLCASEQCKLNSFATAAERDKERSGDERFIRKATTKLNDTGFPNMRGARKQRRTCGFLEDHHARRALCHSAVLSVRGKNKTETWTTFTFLQEPQELQEFQSQSSNICHVHRCHAPSQESQGGWTGPHATPLSGPECGQSPSPLQ